MQKSPRTVHVPWGFRFIGFYFMTFFALKLIDLHPSLDKDHQSKFYAIRTFAMNLDEVRLVDEAGMSAVDALYKKYNIARNERSSLIIDPNVDDAIYDLTLGDGTKLKIKVHKNPDGTRDIYAFDGNKSD